MNDFNTLFPNFLSQCAEMNRVLTPIAFVLLAIGVVSSTVTGHRSPSAYLRTIGRTFAIAATLAYLPTWSNEPPRCRYDGKGNAARRSGPRLRAIQAGTYAEERQSERRQLQVLVGPARCACALRDVHLGRDVAARFSRERHRLLRVSRSKVHSLRRLCARADFHRDAGGANAALDRRWISSRLCRRDLLADRLGRSFAPYIRSDPIHERPELSRIWRIHGRAGYGLQNLMGLAALALWLISSTIAAPIILQKAIATGAQVGQGLVATATTAGVAGATAGAGAAATFGAAGGFAGFAAGTAAGGSAALLGAAEASTSGSSYSPLGNMVGSLGASRSPRRPRKPKKNDPTGDDAVRELLRTSRS